MTLQDLRVIMKQELDRRLVPKRFRFMYRGSVCAARQVSLC